MLKARDYSKDYSVPELLNRAIGEAICLMPLGGNINRFIIDNEYTRELLLRVEALNSKVKEEEYKNNRINYIIGKELKALKEIFNSSIDNIIKENIMFTEEVSSNARKRRKRNSSGKRG